MRKKLNTMAELSDAIGVSRPTLSRYFQESSAISQSKRETIERGLEQFDYEPSFFARNLNRRKTRVLGVVIPSISDRFYTSLVEEIEEYAKRDGYTVIIQNSKGDQEKEMEALKQLRSMNAAGVIIAPIGGNWGSQRYQQINEDLPLIFMDSRPPGDDGVFTRVGTDHNQSIRLLVDYLCRTGTPPVFLAMPLVNSNANERLLAYEARMAELGFEPQLLTPANIEPTWEFESFAYKYLSSEFAQGNLVRETILCANDRLAMGALRAANEHGLFQKGASGERHFRVAGHDNHPLSSFLWPPLTTVSQNAKEMARVAFELFCERSPATGDDKVAIRTCLLPAELVIRESA